MSAEMSSGQSTKVIPPQDILKELRNFVAGATHVSKANPQELARTALFLLKTLPAAKDAVLEYMCTLFDDAVSKYTSAMDVDVQNSTSDSPTQEDAILNEIHSVLLNFISSNAEAWAPIISTWSLDLLGQLSTRYSSVSRVPHGSSLNETLQMWLSCRATRTLIDITSHCFTCLIHSDTDACVSALLDTSVKHSPHFDWVVAHIGGCFPRMVITRVLSCGLRDFFKSCQQLKGQMLVGINSLAPKLNSVVGILGHLAGSHASDIKKALLDLFEQSLTNSSQQPNQATVPYLLQLASMSDMLRHALMSSVLPALSPETVNTLAGHIPVWINGYFGTESALTSLVVHLILGSEEMGAKAINLILRMATDSEQKSTRKVAQELVETLLQEISQQLRHTSTQAADSIAVLNSVEQSIVLLQPDLLGKDMFRARTLTELVTLLTLYRGTSATTSMFAYVLLNATTSQQLAVAVELIRNVECVHPTVLTDCVGHVLNIEWRSVNVWQNFIRLLKWEEADKCVLKSKVSAAIHSKLTEFLNHMYDEQVASWAAEVLSLAKMPLVMDISLLMNSCESAAHYFFATLEINDEKQKLKESTCARSLLMDLSSRSVAQSKILRLLLQGCLSKKWSALFGGKGVKPSAAHDVVLFKENGKYGRRVTLPQYHASLSHAGIIGSGLKQRPNIHLLPDATIQINSQLLLETVKACCIPHGLHPDQLPESQLPTVEGMNAVALLLVELISPDVMFNGLPWPDEEFSRVTVERDLHIYNMFQEHPIIWKLLHTVAVQCPSLCYCSVLLRAVTAVMMTHWATSQSEKAVSSPIQLTTTQNIVKIMVLGHLLPYPLAGVSDIFAYLTPFEVQLILKDIWTYMRDNVPAPTLFAKDNKGHVWRDMSVVKMDKQYTERLRLILLANMDKIGHMYSHFFPVKS